MIGNASRGRDSPYGPLPAQIRASGLRSTRLLARVIAACVMPSAIPLTTQVLGPASGVWKLSNGIALAPPPSLHPLRSSLRWFVQELRRYYAAVRLPECVHRRRTVTPFPTRSALDCSAGTDCSMTDTPRLSRLGAHDASVHAQVSDPAEFMPPLPERVA
jgi:hypothetical protein